MAQVGGSCARGSNKCAIFLIFPQYSPLFHIIFWYVQLFAIAVRKNARAVGHVVPPRAGAFPHRYSEKLDNGLPEVVSKYNFPLVILTRHVKTKHKSKRERASAPDLCRVCPRIATRARGKVKRHFW